MFLWSKAVPEQAIAADGVYTFDMGVNPLSIVMIGIRPLNDTGTLANFAGYRELAQALNKVSILYQGQSIVSARGEDLMALAMFRHGILPFQGNNRNTDNDRRSFFLPILLGRHAYDGRSCFPATRRGDLVLELDCDIADTGYDGLRLSVDICELLDAKPKEYERKISINQTFAATGDQDIDLPLATKSRGMLLYATTTPIGPTPAPSFGSIRVMVDNQEVGFSPVDQELAMSLPSLYGRQVPLDEHIHTLDATVAGITNTTSVYGIGLGTWDNYALLDFDPTGDDAHTLDVTKARRFILRSNVETADAVRVLPIEAVSV